MSDQFEKYLKENKPRLSDENTRPLKASLFQKIEKKSPLKFIIASFATICLVVTITFKMGTEETNLSEIDSYLASHLSSDYYTSELEESYYGKELLSSL